MFPLAIFGLGVPELLIILAVVLLLFGGSRLAGLGKSTGRALKEFKEETKGLKAGETPPGGTTANPYETEAGTTFVQSPQVGTGYNQPPQGGTPYTQPPQQNGAPYVQPQQNGTPYVQPQQNGAPYSQPQQDSGPTQNGSPYGPASQGERDARRDV